MKDIFPEYYPYDKNEVDELFNNAIIALDTNILLNIYRYSDSTYEEFIGMLRNFSEADRLFIPHYAGIEFFDNRVAVIAEQDDKYKKHTSAIGAVKEAIKELCEIENEHPYVDKVRAEKVFKYSHDELREVEKKIKENRPNWSNNDDRLEGIKDIFKQSIGKSYTQYQLEDLYAKGDKRYAWNIPPGFKDVAKNNTNRYGDFVIWEQMIEYAKEKKKDILFVTDDKKDDWWLIVNKKPQNMPLPRLRKEMFDRAEVKFHAFTSKDFTEYCKNIAKLPLSEQAVEEIDTTTSFKEPMPRLAAYGSMNADTVLVENLEYIQKMNRNAIYYLDNNYYLGEPFLTPPELINTQIKKILNHAKAGGDIRQGCSDDIELLLQQEREFLHEVLDLPMLDKEERSWFKLDCWKVEKMLNSM